MKRLLLFASFVLFAVSMFAQGSESGIVYTNGQPLVNSNRNTLLRFDCFVASTPDSKYGPFELDEFAGPAQGPKAAPINHLEFQCPEVFNCDGNVALFATNRAYFNRHLVVAIVVVEDRFYGPDSLDVAVLDNITGNLIWERYGWLRPGTGRLHILCDE